MNPDGSNQALEAAHGPSHTLTPHADDLAVAARALRRGELVAIPHRDGLWIGRQCAFFFCRGSDLEAKAGRTSIL